MSKETRQACYDALNRLAKWRTIFTGWQVGHKTKDDAESAAIRDHREVTMLLRVELNAITRLLLKEKIFSEEDFHVAMTSEAILLDQDYERRFPGIRTSSAGLEFDQRAKETMKDWLL